MPNAWDRPPWPDAGEEDYEPIYRAVGHALSAWAEVEECISYLFVFFVGKGTTNSPAVRAYTSIDGVKNRIVMVRQAAEAWFEQFATCPGKDETIRALN